MAKRRRVYEEIRTMVEQHGGTMEFQREGYRWGAWIVEYAGIENAFPSESGLFPGLDDLLVPNVPNPKHYHDYSRTFIKGAWEKLSKSLSQNSHSLGN